MANERDDELRKLEQQLANYNAFANSKKTNFEEEEEEAGAAEAEEAAAEEERRTARAQERAAEAQERAAEAQASAASNSRSSGDRIIGPSVGFYVMLFIGIFFHVADSWTRFNRFIGKGFLLWGLIYFIYTIFYWFFVVAPYYKKNVWKDFFCAENWASMSMIMGLAWLLPLGIGYLVYGLNYLNKGWGDYATLLMLLAPLWLFLIVFSEYGSRSDGRTSAAQKLVIMYGVCFLVLFFIQYYRLIFGKFGLEGRMMNVYEPIMKFYMFVLSAIHKIPQLGTDLQKEWDRQIAIAKGEYDPAMIDKKAKERLGVYIDDIKATSEFFEANEDVSIFGVLRAKTLEAPINISLNCYTEQDGIRIIGSKVVPDITKDLEVYGEEEYDIDCIFDKGTLKKGTHTLKVTADFNFYQHGYKKFYMADEEKTRALGREGIAILSHYGIKDEDPDAIFTSGPVMVGVGIKNPPIKVDRNDPETMFTVGFTIDNSWEGKLRRMNQFALILPKGIELLKEKGTEIYNCGGYPFAIHEEIEEESSEFTAYEMNDPKRLKEIKELKAIRCPVRIEKSNYQQVLGDTPITTQYIRSFIAYDYHIEKEKIITVKKSEYDALAQKYNLDIGKKSKSELKISYVQNLIGISAKCLKGDAYNAVEVFEQSQIKKNAELLEIKFELKPKDLDKCDKMPYLFVPLIEKIPDLVETWVSEFKAALSGMQKTERDREKNNLKQAVTLTLDHFAIIEKGGYGGENHNAQKQKLNGLKAEIEAINTDVGEGQEEYLKFFSEFTSDLTQVLEACLAGNIEEAKRIQTQSSEISDLSDTTLQECANNPQGMATEAEELTVDIIQDWVKSIKEDLPQAIPSRVDQIKSDLIESINIALGFFDFIKEKGLQSSEHETRKQTLEQLKTEVQGFAAPAAPTSVYPGTAPTLTISEIEEGSIIRKEHAHEIRISGKGSGGQVYFYDHDFGEYNKQGSFMTNDDIQQHVRSNTDIVLYVKGPSGVDFGAPYSYDTSLEAFTR